MNNVQTYLEKYLAYCKHQKQLDPKTLKAYRIDLTQFEKTGSFSSVSDLTPEPLEHYIETLHQQYKPKTVKRKIASLKAFIHYLDYKEIIPTNPFHKISVRFREPVKLPKTIPLNTVELFLSTIYRQYREAKTDYQKKNALRDAAIIELLFATGMRISELCMLNTNDINLYDGTILIYGKGRKERRLQIGSTSVIQILREYKKVFQNRSGHPEPFFINQNGKNISDQAIRRMIHKYSSLAGIQLHITPHMFRHTFATSLLEADVDIRYIQEMLGHSSINITELYTHVATSKQRDILLAKHPRKNFHLQTI